MKRSAHTTSSYFAILGIGACFVAWASLFIYNSSFVGIDGRRYFYQPPYDPPYVAAYPSF